MFKSLEIVQKVLRANSFSTEIISDFLKKGLFPQDFYQEKHDSAAEAPEKEDAPQKRHRELILQFTSAILKIFSPAEMCMERTLEREKIMASDERSCALPAERALQQARSALQSAEQELEFLLQEEADTDTASLQEAVSALREELQEAQDLLEAKSQSLNDAERALVEEQRNETPHESRMGLLESERDRAKREHAEQEERVTSLAARFQEAEQKANNGALNESITAARTKVETAQQTVAEAEAHAEEMKRTQETAISRFQVLNTEIEELATTISQTFEEALRFYALIQEHKKVLQELSEWERAHPSFISILESSQTDAHLRAIAMVHKKLFTHLTQGEDGLPVEAATAVLGNYSITDLLPHKI